jgi:rhamnose transport system ATP-binding protein
VQVGTVRLLELVDISKRFGSVLALDAVSLALDAGSIHAIVGENGAGKSTLVNVLSGVWRPDTGTIRLEGSPVVLSDPGSARQRGILTVHQELELFAPLSVAENLALSLGLPSRHGIVNWRGIRHEADRAASVLREAIDVSQPAGQLPVAQRQMIRIAAALDQPGRVLLLDEPTSSLSEAETRWLFEHLRALRLAGWAIVYISHRTSEVFEIADHITVLRDGRTVWSGATAETSPAQLVEAMVGREYAPPDKRAVKDRPGSAQARLEVRELTDAQGRFRRVTLNLTSGEIVGLYGLVGAGRSELAQAIFGLRKCSGGTIRVDDRPVAPTTPQEALAAGIAYLPEDRLTEGLFHNLTVRTNAAIASLERVSRGPFTSPARERLAVRRQLDAFLVRCRDLEQPIAELSGGNQQKIVLARSLLARPKILLLDEPTRGVDMRAKAEIHCWLREWVSQGNAALLIASDLSEVIEHADRIVVFREGEVSGEFAAPEATPQRVAHAALSQEGPRRSAVVRERRAWSGRFRNTSIELGLLAAICLLAIVLSMTTAGFLTRSNLVALLTNTAVWSILALGSAVVIISGGIDISVGAILALAAALAAMILKSTLPELLAIPLAILAAVVIGAFAGGVNAGVALAGRVHPIVVTLATMTAYRGMLILVTGGEAITGLPRRFDRIATGNPGGVNGSMIVMALCLVAMHFWLRHTVWGRRSYALGASSRSAAMVGISKNRVWIGAFSLGGAMAALAGVLELAQSGSMQASLGSGYELRAIAGAVIGGVAITGGRGTALGVFLGALLISLVHNALVLWQVSRYHTDLVVGGIILAAVLWDLLWRKLETA